MTDFGIKTKIFFYKANSNKQHMFTAHTNHIIYAEDPAESRIMSGTNCQAASCNKSQKLKGVPKKTLQVFKSLFCDEM